MLGQIKIINYIKYKYYLWSTFYLLIVIFYFLNVFFLLIFVCMNESNFEIKIINCYKGICIVSPC